MVDIKSRDVTLGIFQPSNDLVGTICIPHREYDTLTQWCLQSDHGFDHVRKIELIVGGFSMISLSGWCVAILDLDNSCTSMSLPFPDMCMSSVLYTRGHLRLTFRNDDHIILQSDRDTMAELIAPRVAYIQGITSMCEFKLQGVISDMSAQIIVAFRNVTWKNSQVLPIMDAGEINVYTRMYSNTFECHGGTYVLLLDDMARLTIGRPIDVITDITIKIKPQQSPIEMILIIGMPNTSLIWSGCGPTNIHHPYQFKYKMV